MMKLINYIFLLLPMVSCITTYHKEDFATKLFESRNQEMVGNYSLKFENDSIFSFTQRNGFLYTKGLWDFSNSSDYIVLDSYSSDELNIKRFGENDSIVYYTLTDNEVKIVNKNQLIYKGIRLRLKR